MADNWQQSPTGAIHRMAGMRVLVIGEAMLDSYSEGDASRICQEAPVPIVAVKRHLDAPGGAANVAANAAALGAQVTLLSVIGNDVQGQTLRRALTAAGVDDSTLVECPGRDTLAKHRIVANGQLIVRYDQGDTSPLSSGAEDAILRALEPAFEPAEAVIISDYNYGLLTPQVIRLLTELHRQRPRTLLVDSRRLASFRSLAPTIVKPNFAETCALLGEGVARAIRSNADAGAGQKVLQATGATIAAVTNDSDGAVIFERDRLPVRVSVRHSAHAAPAGAGDTFGAVFTLAIAAGANVSLAADLAAEAAATVVASPGTAVCTTAKLAAAFSLPDKYAPDWAKFEPVLARYRLEGRRIVFTNGCFDILHSGHINYLARSRALGDLLIVGLNSDETVRALKGEGRPVNSIKARARVLAALDCVDHVLPFTESTAERVVRFVQPQVYTKGGDYTEALVPEAAIVRELGGEVCIVPLTEHESTSAMIARILAAARPSVAQSASAPA